MTPYITIASTECPLGNEKLCSCTNAHGNSGRDRLKCSFITSSRATPPSAAAATSTASSLSPHHHINPTASATANTLFIDVHTHLYMPSLGKLGLWGIDELLTYHYLEAELFRSSPISPSEYWALGKKEQADLIWRTLFVENPPVSEAARGVIAVLSAFGLP